MKLILALILVLAGCVSYPPYEVEDMSDLTAAELREDMRKDREPQCTDRRADYDRPDPDCMLRHWKWRQRQQARREALRRIEGTVEL